MLLLLLLISSVTSQFYTSYQDGPIWQHEVKDEKCKNCTGDSRPSCSMEAGCEDLNNNLIDIVYDIDSELLCQQLCSYTADFSWYTWGSCACNSCWLFSSCDVLIDTCRNCFSGPAVCPPPRPSCSIDVGCAPQGDNLLNIINDVNTEAECQLLCADTTDCTLYTWYTLNTCFLFSACDILDNTCTSCFSGAHLVPGPHHWKR